MLTLFDYFRSSASYRVRIVLNLKGIRHDISEIHLVKDGGEQHSDAYQAINPQGLVPSIKESTSGHDFILHQSLAIIEYLNEKYPIPDLLPSDIESKAQVRSFAYKICCDVHPLNNLRVLNYLESTLRISDEQKLQWYDHWVEEGFRALETQLRSTSQGKFCFGNQPSLADICLIPQVYNAKRFHIDLSAYKTLISIYNHCIDMKDFHDARPVEYH